MVLLLMPWLISSLAEKLWSSSQLSESLMIPLLDNSIKMMIPWVPKTTLIDSEEREEEEDPTQTKWTYISSAFWLEAKNLKRDRERYMWPASTKSNYDPLTWFSNIKSKPLKLSATWIWIYKNFYFSTIRPKLVMVVRCGILPHWNPIKESCFFFTQHHSSSLLDSIFYFYMVN